jgi:DNA-binding PadR family transcriptional regulator
MVQPSLGRFAEPALWILVALGRGPAGATELLRAVRSLGGPIAPGRFIGALARLERGALVERSTAGRQPMYRLASYPDGAAR